LDVLDEYIVKMFSCKSGQTHNSFTKSKTSDNELMISNFVDNISTNESENWKNVDELELELEYIGRGGKSKLSIAPTEKSVNECLKFISNILIKKENISQITGASSNSVDATTSDMYRSILARIAVWVQPNYVDKYISGVFRLRKLAPQVVSLDVIKAHNKLMPNIENYFISPKTDGDRTILIFDHDKDQYFSVSHEVKELNLLDFGCKNVSGGSDEERYPNETILDTEFYVESAGSDILESTGKYYIFDVIAYKGKPVFKEDYEDRIKYISMILNDFEGCSNLVEKPIVKLGADWKKVLTKILDRKWKFETDGWIFTAAKTIESARISARYIKCETWKWKPINVLSIDFLLQNDSLYSGMRETSAEKILHEKAWNKKYSEYGPVVFTPTYIPAAILPSDVDISKLLIILLFKKCFGSKGQNIECQTNSAIL